MKKLIGRLSSKVSGIVYSVLWDQEEKTVWRSTIFNDVYEMIGLNCENEHNAMITAREFLNNQC